MNQAHPVEFSVDYPDRELNRLTSALRVFTVIPIAVVLGTIGGYSERWGTSTAGTTEVVIGGTGLLFIPPLLMILFRQKYEPSAVSGGQMGSSGQRPPRLSMARAMRDSGVRKP